MSYAIRATYVYHGPPVPPVGAAYRARHIDYRQPRAALYGARHDYERFDWRRFIAAISWRYLCLMTRRRIFNATTNTLPVPKALQQHDAGLSRT